MLGRFGAYIGLEGGQSNFVISATGVVYVVFGLVCISCVRILLSTEPVLLNTVIIALDTA